LQNFVYKTQDIQPKENTKQGSSLITWITKYVYRYVNNNDSSKSCIECQLRVMRYWQDLHHTESSYAEYIHSHIFFIHSKRPQCRNPDCDSKRLKCVPYSKIGAGRFKIVRNFVNFSSDGTKATLANKGESRKNDQITGSNRTLNSLKSSNDIRLYKLFGYFSSKGKSIIFLPFRHLICSRDMKQENQRCCSEKDKFSSHLALSNELVNTYTANSYEGKPGINLTSFYEDTLQKSFLEQTPSSMQDELVMSDLSSKEVLASVHETGISSTTASSEKKSEFEVTSFSQDTLEESTVEHTSSLIQDTSLESDASSKEVLASVHETGISFTATSSEKKSEFEVTSFSQNTLEESNMEQKPSSIQDVILMSDARSDEVLASVHKTGISSTTATDGRPGIEGTLFNQNTSKESTVDQTPSPMVDAVVKSYFRKGDILDSNSHSRMYTAVGEFSGAKASRIYTYMHEAHSRSNTIEETSKDNKAVVPAHGHVIISSTVKKLANTLLRSSYSSYMESIADNPANGLKIEAWQKATPLLRTVEVTQLKSTLLSELSSKDLEVSLQKSSGIVRTSTGVQEQVEVLETERYGDSVDDSFEEGTESIEASMMHNNFSPFMEFNSLLLKSKNPPAVLKSKSILDKRFELSPSYKMQSAALTEIDDNNKLPLIPTKYSRQLSSTVLEKPLSKVEMKQDSLNPAKEISVQKSESGNSVSERTMAMHKISLSRIDSEFSSNMFLLSSTQVKFASQSLLQDVTAKQSDIDFSMTHSQTHYLPKNSYIDARKKMTKDQQFVDADASSKFPESKKGNKQWKKEGLEGKIVAEKLSGNIKISTDENTLLKSSEVNEKEITKASENTESDIIGTRRTEIDSDKSETMKVVYSDAGTSETILLNQIDSHLKRNTTISEPEIQLTTSITTIAMSGDPTFEKENQKLPHLAQKTDEFGWDSSKPYAVKHKNFDDTFGFEDSYNGSLVAPIVNLKEIEEGKIFILSPDFIILLTLLILVCYKLLRRSLQRYSPSKEGNRSNNKEKPQIETVTTKFDIFMAPTGEIKFELKQELKIT